MTTLLSASIAIQLSLAALLVLLLATLLTSTLLHRASAAARHLVWTAAALATLCLPLLALLPAPSNLPAALAPLPRLTASLPALPVAQEPTSPAPSAPDRASRLTFSRLQVFLLPTYMLGLLIPLTPLLLSPWLLARLKRRATPATDPALLSTLDQCRRTLELSRPTPLLLADSPAAMPLTFGLFRPHILLPSAATTWPTDKLRLVLSHELAHVKRHDCLTLYLAQLARAIHWFNPLAHLAVRRMYAERERACDDLVLSATSARPSDYADTLLHLTSSLRPAPALLPVMPMSRPTHLHTRLLAILDPARNRAPLTRRLTLVVLLLTPLLTLPLACSPNKPKPQAAASSASPPAETLDCMRNLRDLASCMTNDYAASHALHYPATLGDTLPYLAKSNAQTGQARLDPAQVARKYQCPLTARAATDSPTPRWVNEHTSYTYLGSARLMLGTFTDDEWEHTVILHDDLAHPHRDAAGNPVTVVAYLDSHAQLLPVEEARREIENSRKTLAAAARRTSKPAAAVDQHGWTPETSRIAVDLRQLGQSITLYANAHAGLLPPDLASTLPAGAPAADRDRLFNQYVYLGSPKLRLADLPASQTILAHEDLGSPHPHPTAGPVVVALFADGHTELLTVRQAYDQDLASRQLIDARLTAAARKPAASAPPAPLNSSNPQSETRNPQPRPVPFQLGASYFPPGDSIHIDKLEDLTPTAPADTLHTYRITGTYTLASHDDALIGAEITTNDDPASKTGGKGGYAPATKGTSPFSLTFTFNGHGWPHLSFYPRNGGQSFASLYYGTGTTLLSHADWIAPKPKITLSTQGPAGEPFTATLSVDGQHLSLTGTSPAQYTFEARTLTGDIRRPADHQSAPLSFELSQSPSANVSFGVRSATRFHYESGSLTATPLP